MYAHGRQIDSIASMFNYSTLRFTMLETSFKFLTYVKAKRI